MRKNTPKCRSCKHRINFADEFVCWYLMDTGEPRGCPIGKKCTRYERGKPAHRKSMPVPQKGNRTEIQDYIAGQF